MRLGAPGELVEVAGDELLVVLPVGPGAAEGGLEGGPVHRVLVGGVVEVLVQLPVLQPDGIIKPGNRKDGFELVFITFNKLRLALQVLG